MPEPWRRPATAPEPIAVLLDLLLSLNKLLQQIDHCRCVLILAFELAMIRYQIIDLLLGEGNVFPGSR